MDDPQVSISAQVITETAAVEVDVKAVDTEKCNKERDDAFENINKSQEEYDKQLLTLSTGFIAVMLAFIKDIIPLDKAIRLPLLYLSGSLLVLCVLCVLISFRISIFGHFKVMGYWEARLANKNSDFPMGSVRLVRIFNEISGPLFLAGVTCCLLFVGINLHHGAQMDRNPINEGREIKPPIPADLEKRGLHIKVPVSSPQPSATPNTTQQSNGGSNQNK